MAGHNGNTILGIPLEYYARFSGIRGKFNYDMDMGTINDDLPCNVIYE